YTPAGHAIQANGIQPNVLVTVSKKDPASEYPELRERDLEGHLAAEERIPAPANQRVVEAPEKAKLDPIELAKIPETPTPETDFILSLGYQTLKEQLGAPTK
ncbi:MAG: S41 family peptidase, partial [Polyangiaceae bacterium]